VHDSGAKPLGEFIDDKKNRIRPKPTSNAFAKNLNPQFSLRESQETPSEVLDVHFGSFADVTKKAFCPLSTMKGHCGTDSMVQANQRAALLCYPATTKGIARRP
jgi:hypothetical protein